MFLPMHPTHPTSQPPLPPLLSAGAVPIPTSPLLNLGQKEDLKKISAEADVLLCSCRTSKPRRGRGQLPPGSTAPRPLAADGHRSPSSARVGGETPPHHPPAMGSQPMRLPGARRLGSWGSSKAPCPRAFGGVRACVRALGGELARMKEGK